jgi:hypothetical protein
MLAPAGITDASNHRVITAPSSSAEKQALVSLQWSHHRHGHGRVDDVDPFERRSSR